MSACGPTHHNACDCREAAHAVEVAALTEERDALISENHDLTDERDGVIRERDSHASIIASLDDRVEGLIRERDAAREEAGELRAAYDRMWLAQDGATTARSLNSSPYSTTAATWRTAPLGRWWLHFGPRRQRSPRPPAMQEDKMASDDLLTACVDDAAHEIHRRWGEPHGDEVEPLDDVLVQETARAIVTPFVDDLREARRQRDELLEAIDKWRAERWGVQRMNVGDGLLRAAKRIREEMRRDA